MDCISPSAFQSPIHLELHISIPHRFTPRTCFSGRLSSSQAPMRLGPWEAAFHLFLKRSTKCANFRGSFTVPRFSKGRTQNIQFSEGKSHELPFFTLQGTQQQVRTGQPCWLLPPKATRASPFGPRTLR